MAVKSKRRIDYPDFHRRLHDEDGIDYRHILEEWRGVILLNKLKSILDKGFYTAEEWDEIFDFLIQTIGNEQTDISERAVERVVDALWKECDQSYRQKGFIPKEAAQRLSPILKAVEMRETKIPDTVDLFCDRASGFAEEESYHSLIIQWLDGLAQDKKEHNLSIDSLLTAKIRIGGCGRTWPEAKESLIGYLDHPDVNVRACAAEQIGNFYTRDEKMPSLDEMMFMIKQKEIKRPGIAGPFWGAIDFDFERIKAENKVVIDVGKWMFDILEHRNGDEPELRHINGIDFYAHEFFAGHAPSIQRLLELGKLDIAIEAATEFKEKIIDLEPILMELGYHHDPEIVRQAVWHLAYYYHRLHPHGKELGFVELLTELPEVDLFINYANPGFDYPYAAVIYPKNDLEFLTESVAWGWVDKVIPPEIRGDIALNVLSPAKSTDPVILGDKKGYTFSKGAIIEFYGIPSKEQWRSIMIIWYGKPNDCDPRRQLQMGR